MRRVRYHRGAVLRARRNGGGIAGGAGTAEGMEGADRHTKGRRSASHAVVYIDADHYESDPFDAALIAIAPLWKRGYAREVEEFLFKWDDFFRGSSNCQQLSVATYIEELESLVDKLLSA